MYVEGEIERKREKEKGIGVFEFLEGLEETTNQKEGARIKWRVGSKE